MNKGCGMVLGTRGKVWGVGRTVCMGHVQARDIHSKHSLLFVYQKKKKKNTHFYSTKTLTFIVAHP